MAQSRDERLAYARGYNRGNRWPEHKPPTPPHETVGKIVEAAKRLADSVRSELATFDPDDEIEDRLGPPLDELDAALTAITQWLRDGDVDNNT